MSFAHKLVINYSIVFCTEHGSTTVVAYAKFQNDSTRETDVMDARDFAKFESKMSFGQISYIAQHS